MKTTDYSYDLTLLAENPDNPEIKNLYIAVQETGHWSLVWPIYNPWPREHHGQKPAGYKSVEIMFQHSEFRYRVCFRRGDGQTQKAWRLFEVGSLSLDARNALVALGEHDEAYIPGNGDCKDCVRRLVKLFIKRVSARSYLL